MQINTIAKARLDRIWTAAEARISMPGTTTNSATSIQTKTTQANSAAARSSEPVQSRSERALAVAEGGGPGSRRGGFLAGEVGPGKVNAGPGSRGAQEQDHSGRRQNQRGRQDNRAARQLTHRCERQLRTMTTAAPAVVSPASSCRGGQSGMSPRDREVNRHVRRGGVRGGRCLPRRRRAW